MHKCPHILAPVFLVFATLAAQSCAKDDAWKEPGPKDVFDTFLMSWFRGEPEVAFEQVLPADRDALIAPLKDADDLPEQYRPKPHEMLVVADIKNVYDIAKMEVSETFDQEPPVGQQVTLTLHHQDGSTSRAELVWSGGRWYLDLPLSSSKDEG